MKSQDLAGIKSIWNRVNQVLRHGHITERRRADDGPPILPYLLQVIESEGRRLDKQAREEAERAGAGDERVIALQYRVAALQHLSWRLRSHDVAGTYLRTIMEYSRVLARHLSEDRTQVLLSANYSRELELRTHRKKYVLDEYKMTPAMQALEHELASLLDTLSAVPEDDIVAFDLVVMRMTVVRKLQLRWLIGESAKKNEAIAIGLTSRVLQFDVGGDWRMLVYADFSRS